MSSKFNRNAVSLIVSVTFIFVLACTINLSSPTATPAPTSTAAAASDSTKVALEVQATQLSLQLTQAFLAGQAPAATAPPVVSSLPEWPFFQQGESGPEILAIQYLLRARGYGVSADGYFGSDTYNAILDFQTQNRLSIDGIVGPQTWSFLIDGIQYANPSNGEVVVAIQTLLHDKFNEIDLPIDGLFGPVTEAAVLRFQTYYGLIADGIVGPETWQALISYSY